METPPVSPEVRAALDAEHLRLLGIVYYIAGGMTAAVSCIFIFHATIFTIFGLNPEMFQNSNTANGQHAHPPPPGLFLALGGLFFALIFAGWIFGALQIFAGYSLGRRRNLTFVYIIAALECVSVPWGTAIGVFSFIVLTRPSVRALFGYTW
jgi:hypothetical protein